jgi:predicted oxidoreductase
VFPQSPDETKAIAAIKKAFDYGVNFFDVAPFYGAGDAERLLGRGLQQLPREEIFVCSKVCMQIVVLNKCMLSSRVYHIKRCICVGDVTSFGHAVSLPAKSDIMLVARSGPKRSMLAS